MEDGKEEEDNDNDMNYNECKEGVYYLMYNSKTLNLRTQTHQNL